MICASLYAAPATIEDLANRDFLKTYSMYGISRILQNLERDEKVYFKGNKYHTYSAYAKSKEMADYELN